VAFLINKEDYKLNEDETTYLGFKLPFSFGINSEILHTKTIDNVKDNLLNLLLTNPGDRVFQPNLGVNISNLLFEDMGEDVDQFNAELREEVEAKVGKWMPFIKINSVEAISNHDRNTYNIKVNFSFLRSAQMNESIQIEIPAGGY
jgi:phage baseplate assembly protein W